ncbi:MAG: GFA family protein [Alphaproteobacteria bacterium]|nr:GFA family protein [Alphaproteobacteria bacterium]
MRGSCLCGTVAFQINGDRRRIYQCHCSLCRKQGGAASNAAMIVETGELRWISGQEQISSYVKPTGFRSDFCARCGSPVPNPLRTMDYYWVPAGLLDDDASLDVAAHLFVGSKASWDAISPGVRQFETMPELSVFIALLHARS